MKIFYWTDGFWPRVGGIETQGLHLLVKLQERGHECLVLAQRDQPSWKEEELYRGIQIKRLNFLDLIEKRDLSSIRPIKEYLEWVISNFKPDIVYLNTVMNGTSAAFLLLRHLFPMPVILTFQSPYFDELAPPILERIFSKCDVVCCISKWTMNIARQHCPSVKEKIRLIYHGLETPSLAPAPLPFSPPVILALGRLVPEKGVDRAVVAFALLRRGGMDARMLIAGDGPERKKIEEMVDRLLLRPYVEFLGMVKIENVYETINRATLVVMPSTIESFGLVAVEAMQMGRPVIASNIGGLPEVILDKATGLLVPSQDSMSLSIAMESLLKNPTDLIEMGRLGKERSKFFSIERNVEQYEALFAQVLRPLVSVILSVHNGEKYIRAAIESILEQTYAPIEIVAVDDGSVDGCRQLLQSYGSRVRYHYQVNQGQSTALNVGIGLARGKYLSFLDHDDLYTPDKTESQVAFLEANPEFDFVFGHLEQFHSPDLSLEARERWLCPQGSAPGYIAGAGLFRKECFERAGLFLETQKIGGFVEWYMRAVDRGLKGQVRPDLVLRRRIHETNMGIQCKNERIEYVKVVKEALRRRRDAVLR